MTYQASTGALILDYQLNHSSTPLTWADIASYLAGGLNDVNTFQNSAARGFLPQKQGNNFSKTGVASATPQRSTAAHIPKPPARMRRTSYMFG